jgi:hypothetical protein
MNFQGSRDDVPAKKQYREVLSYLLQIQTRFPHIYKRLEKVPQFEYEVEIYRTNTLAARHYLSVLNSLVEGFDYKAKAGESKQSMDTQLHPSLG